MRSGLIAVALMVAFLSPAASEESGFRPMFDDSSLANWDCDGQFWRAEGSAIVGQTRPDHQPKQNTFCIWRGGEPGDFDLRLEYKLTGDTDGNSGIQYRSIERPDVARWVMEGYQADIDLKQQYTGQIYEERGRTFLAMRGQVATVVSGAKPAPLGSLGDSGDLRKLIHDNDWNTLEIVAKGDTLVQILNGRAMSIFVDNDRQRGRREGKIGIQLHKLASGMRIEVRNIRIKML